ncbi:MAG: pantetheine-phosphate adenylyltransferase [Flavobacteriales bacterium]
MSTKRIAVFAGTFDPITLGHVSIVERGLSLFDEIVIGIGHNSNKQGYFHLETREAWIKKIFSKYPNVSVESYEGLTIDFCKKVNARFILRGLRDGKDFEYERSLGMMNHAIANEIETVYLVTEPQYSAINSIIIRDILKHGGDASQFLPKEVNEDV